MEEDLWMPPKMSIRHALSRNDAVGFGSATVSVALSGVSPDNPSLISPSPNSEKLNTGKVFGETPKTAVETTALPNPTASFRLNPLPGRSAFGAQPPRP